MTAVGAPGDRPEDGRPGRRASTASDSSVTVSRRAGRRRSCTSLSGVGPGADHRRAVVHRVGQPRCRSATSGSSGSATTGRSSRSSTTTVPGAVQQLRADRCGCSSCSAVGMLFAYLLDKNLRGGRFYQSIYYFPVVLSLAVVGFIWKSVMFSPRSGIAEHGLARADRSTSSATRRRSSSSTCRCSTSRSGSRSNFAALLIAMAWRHIGYVMVLYLAGLKAVDHSLREAAAIDGCNEWQSFRRVVFPSLQADQRRRRRDHGDRGAAGLRHRRRPQEPRARR